MPATRILTRHCPGLATTLLSAGARRSSGTSDPAPSIVARAAATNAAVAPAPCRRPRPPASRSLRRRGRARPGASGDGAAGAGPAAGQPPCSARATAARRGSPPSSVDRASFFEQGNVSAIEPQTYLYYIQPAAEPAVAGVWMPYDEAHRADVLEDFKRSVGTNFLDDLSIEVIDAPVRQRRHRQARRLRHRGAAARQDRRLHRQQEDRPDQDRREAEGRERHHPPRLVHRPGLDPPRRRRRPRADGPRRATSTPR